MCSRRHKGMFQTSLILVLIVCVGYAYYLHNLLQVKIKYLDSKTIQHRSQQQSLSSQLKAAQEDRAGLEKAVQKSKGDYQKMKEEKEAMIRDMLMEHQDKSGALTLTNKELKDKNTQLSSENENLQNKHDKINKDHEQLREKHRKALIEYREERNLANEELERYRNENQAVQRLRHSLEQDVAQARGNHQSLQDALKAVPADAVNFNHPVVQNIPDDMKRILLDHLGERRDELVQARQHMQQRMDQPLPQQQQQGYDQQGNQRQFGGGLPAPQENDVAQRQQYPPESYTVDVCRLEIDHGPCDSAETRYGFHGDVNDCKAFEYGGCGGNQNNFQSFDLCRSVCSDPARRYVKRQDFGQMQRNPFAAEDNPPENQQPAQNAQQGIHHVVGQPAQKESFQGNAVLENDVVHDPNTVVEQPVQNRLHSMEQQEKTDPKREEEQQVDEAQQIIEKSDGQSKLIHEAEIQVKGEEEAAKKELENQQQQLNQDEDPLERLKQNSLLQLQLAQDQHADMQKALKQKRRDDQGLDPIHARVVDEGNGENDEDNNLIRDAEEEDGDDDEIEDVNGDHAKQEKGDVQVMVPPAAPVVEQDPEAVMNAPPAKEQIEIDSEESKRQDILELDGGNELGDHQEEGDSEIEENRHEEHEEEEDYNHNLNEDFDDDDKVDDQKFEDAYANEEEDPKEQEYRKKREDLRIIRDRNFAAMNEVMKLVPEEFRA